MIKNHTHNLNLSNQMSDRCSKNFLSLSSHLVSQPSQRLMKVSREGQNFEQQNFRIADVSYFKIN